MQPVLTGFDYFTPDSRTMRKMLRVNEAARELGVSEAWLRRSERTGRIPMARRDLNGWRVYTEADVATLRELLLPTTQAAPGADL